MNSRSSSEFDLSLSFFLSLFEALPSESRGGSAARGASETPSRRPTAAACLSRCLQRLGRRMALCSAETARARVATWTGARMDVGTGGKKSAKEAREKVSGARSGSAPESESEGGDYSRERGGHCLDGGAGEASVEARGGEPRSAGGPPRRRRERDGSESARIGIGGRRDAARLAARRSRRRRETRPGGQAAEDVSSGVGDADVSFAFVRVRSGRRRRRFFSITPFFYTFTQLQRNRDDAIPADDPSKHAARIPGRPHHFFFTSPPRRRRGCPASAS